MTPNLPCQSGFSIPTISFDCGYCVQKFNGKSWEIISCKCTAGCGCPDANQAVFAPEARPFVGMCQLFACVPLGPHVIPC